MNKRIVYLAAVALSLPVASALGCNTTSDKSVSTPMTRSVEAQAAITVGGRLSQGFDIRDVASGARIHVSLDGAADAKSEKVPSGILYRGAMPGSDVLVTAARAQLGTNLLVGAAPAKARSSYTIAFAEKAGGLRVDRGALEVLTLEGRAAMFLEPPTVVGRDGKVQRARVEVTGCTLGAIEPSRTCTVTIDWTASAVQYPAELRVRWDVLGSTPPVAGLDRPMTHDGGMTNLTPSASSYTFGQTIDIAYTGMPGNYTDWIALAAPGSGAGSYVRWTYTYGATSGTASFTGNTPLGTYVARAYYNDGNTIQEESSQFTVMAAGDAGTTTVTTDQSSYMPGSTAVVTFSNMQGNAYDWLSIATQGSGPTTYQLWTYTNGELSGTRNFDLTGLPNGSYVARAYFNNSYTVEAESAPFTLGTVSDGGGGGGDAGATTVTTNQSAYAPGSTAMVTYTNMQGNTYDWISIAGQGSAPTSYELWTYTNGQINGNYPFNLTGLANGNYVARAYFNNTYVIAAESAPFFLGPLQTVTTNQSSYAVGETIVVNYTGLQGTPTDWIALAAPASAVTSYVRWTYTGGTPAGSVSFMGSTPVGNYVARSFNNDSYTLVAESAQFSVAAPSDAGATTVMTDQTSYTTAQTAVVSFTNASGASTDWLSIAAQGSGNTSFELWQYTGGGLSGSRNFGLSTLSPGTYVARIYFNDTYVVQAESASFTVTP